MKRIILYALALFPLMVSAQDSFPEAVSVGKTYTDFSAETLDGQSQTLSDFMEGKKLTLVDFWASWCGPCMNSMPHLASLYKEFSDKGLEIVGVSLDKEYSGWKNALDNNDMPWKQIRSTGDGNAGQIYGVQFIPHVMLIDQNGKIIVRGIGRDELTAKIKEILE